MTTRPFRIRTAADVLALVPFTLGFHPVDSLVLVTLDAGKRPFQARIDLPDDVEELHPTAAHLVNAAVRNGAERALVIAYTDDECLGEAAAAALIEALDHAGVPTLMAIRADGTRWFPVAAGPATDADPEGEPYDVRDHELSSVAVLEGRVTFRDRAELAESLSAADPLVVEQTVARLEELAPLPVAGQELLLESLWLMEAVRGHVEQPRPLDAETVARILRALRNRDVRDLVWADVTKGRAEPHVALWREIVRRSPETAVAPAAGLLAFAAWLAGDGALAWCAVDRCLRADPDHVLGQLVSQALEAAMPPSSWRSIDPATLGLFAG